MTTTVYNVEGNKLAVGLIVTVLVNRLNATLTFWRTPLAVPRNNRTLVLPFNGGGVGALTDALHDDVEPRRDVVGNWEVHRPVAGAWAISIGAGAASGVTVLDSAEKAPVPEG